MALFALTSISGSPGTTTTAVAWATTSPTPTLLLEADMTGGSPILAGRYRAQLPHEKSVLAAATREPGIDVEELLQTQSIPLPGAVADSQLVPTIAERAQARALVPHWPHVGTAIKNLSVNNGIDVVVDLGRYDTPDAAHALTERADALIVVSRTDLPSLIKLVNNLPALIEATPFALLTVCFVQSQIEGFPGGEAQDVLGKIPVAATLAHNPAAAAAYSLGWAQARKRALRAYHADVAQLRTQTLHLVQERADMLTGKGPR